MGVVSVTGACNSCCVLVTALLAVVTAVLLGCVASRPVIGWRLCPSNSTLLPPPTAQNYSLRNRPHNRQLPDHISRITDCNFTVRMLYRNMYWLFYILDLRFVLFLCTIAVWQFAINEYVVCCCTQITDGRDVGHRDIWQLLCFRCMHAVTAHTVIAYSYYTRGPAQYIISVKPARSKATVTTCKHIGL